MIKIRNFKIATSNSVASAPPVLSCENYQSWAVKIKAYLQGLDLWVLGQAIYTWPTKTIDK